MQKQVHLVWNSYLSVAFNSWTLALHAMMDSIFGGAAAASETVMGGGKGGGYICTVGWYSRERTLFCSVVPDVML